MSKKLFNPSYSKQFGQTIRSIRKDKHLTQEQLAKRSGISRLNISKIENGKTEASLIDMNSLAKGLKVGYHELV